MQAKPIIALLTPFVGLCTLRLKPQALPLSSFLTGLTLVTYAATSCATLMALGLPPGRALLGGPLAAGILAGLTFGLLHLRRLPARLPQTLAALAGCGSILNLIGIPLAASVRPNGTGAATGDVAETALTLLILWSFVVSAHILRHAISCSFLVGLALAVAFNIVSGQVLDLFIDFETHRI